MCPPLIVGGRLGDGGIVWFVDGSIVCIVWLVQYAWYLVARLVGGSLLFGLVD